MTTQKTNEEIIEEFESLFVDTEHGLDHAHAEEIRSVGRKLTQALEAKDQKHKEEIEKDLRNGKICFCDSCRKLKKHGMWNTCEDCI